MRYALIDFDHFISVSNPQTTSPGMLRAMTEKLKENMTAFYRWYVGILLTAIGGMTSAGVYVALKINDKIDYSYDKAVEQKIINEQIKENNEAQMEYILINDKRMDLLSERFYQIEAIVKYGHYAPKQN